MVMPVCFCFLWKVVPDAVTFAGLFESVVHATKQMPRPREQQQDKSTGAFRSADGPKP